jgi:FkbM family methyltransferase
MGLKQILRAAVNRVGFDVIRLNRSPRETLLGLSREKFSVIIDVGANQGQFAQMITDFFPDAEIYCFEPLDGPFFELSSWAETRRGRVHCFQLALGEQVGEMEMHLHEEHTPSSSLLAATDTCHELYPQTEAEHLTTIKVSTLDQELDEVLKSVSGKVLLKLDVQGFEDRVLKGGGSVLSSCYAVILEVCLDPLYDGQADFRGLSDMLHMAGFRYAGNFDQVYGEDGRVVYLDAVFIK